MGRIYFLTRYILSGAEGHDIDRRLRGGFRAHVTLASVGCSTVPVRKFDTGGHDLELTFATYRLGVDQSLATLGQHVFEKYEII